MTKSPQRAHHASKPKAATGQRKNRTRTSEPLKDTEGNVGTDVTPKDFFKAWSRKDREALIEVLIDTLDADAGDVDLEPSLGFLEPEITGDGGRHKWPYYSDDARQDVSQGSTCDGEADDGDDEPSLGSVEDHPNPYRDGTDYPSCGRDQSYWAGGGTDDREGDEHDGREPEDYGGEAEKEDDEPSLGWTDREAAFGKYPDVNGCCDLEKECEDEGAQCDDEGDHSDSGIADSDGLLEQCGGLYPNGVGTVAAYARAAI